MKYDIIRRIDSISKSIADLEDLIEHDRKQIEKSEKDIQIYKDELSRICNEYNINIDNLLQ